MIAPLIGSFLNTAWGWRASFVFLLILAMFFTVLLQFFFKETQQEKNLSALNLKQMVHNYYQLIANKNYSKFCLTSGFSYGILFSYFAISPLFLIKQLHFSMINYGLIVAVNGVAIIAMAYLAPRLANKTSLNRVLLMGLFVIAIGGLLMLFVNLGMSLSVWSFMLPMFVTTVGIGMIRPTASAGAMAMADRKVAGSAAAGFNLIERYFVCKNQLQYLEKPLKF